MILACCRCFINICSVHLVSRLEADRGISLPPDRKRTWQCVAGAQIWGCITYLLSSLTPKPMRPLPSQGCRLGRSESLARSYCRRRPASEDSQLPPVPTSLPGSLPLHQFASSLFIPGIGLGAFFRRGCLFFQGLQFQTKICPPPGQPPTPF